ncbi:hypothetical protein PYCC9005_004912 [Savitreella phatthalungensis]
MKTFVATTLLALASAAPSKRQAATPPAGINDGTILNYALTLEHLENTFYRQGLARFSAADFTAAGFPASFHRNLREIASDERSHVAFLTAGLQQAGALPVAECSYKFPYTDVRSFVTLSSVLEGVGVSAYLGAAQFIADPNYLTAAGSILTVESRHSAFIRGSLGQSPFPTPFDTPLDFNEVYTLAAPFITSCPPANATVASSTALGLKAFPSLTVLASNPADAPAGSLCFAAPTSVALAPNTPYYLHFLNMLMDLPVKAYMSAAVPGVACANVPSVVKGQAYVILSATQNPVTDNTVLAGPAIIEVNDCRC